jgi:hypothetical protein
MLGADKCRIVPTSMGPTAEHKDDSQIMSCSSSSVLRLLTQGPGKGSLNVFDDPP